MYAIEVENLCKKFGSFTAVNNISFKVKNAEIFGFLGANGAGKSTTIRMLCGIIAPSSGSAKVTGYCIEKEAEKVKSNIGYMSQKFSLYDDLSVEQNIEFFGGVYGLSNSLLHERKKWVLQIANLSGKEKLLTGSLPGGIKQRLALGTAVIHKPKILFLDEPTSGVDPIERRNFWDLINQLSHEGVTIFVTTHYLEEAEYCNSIILLDSGGVIAQGTSAELKNKFMKKDIYEISGNGIIEVLSFISAQNFVEDCSLFGNKLHVTLKDGFTVVELKNKLASNFINGYFSIDKITPSLEDVFIHLVDKRGKNA